MYKRIIILVLIHVFFQLKCNAQLIISTNTIASTCNSNGAITVNVSNGTAPYIYQIISSSTGIIRPAQNVNVFQNLPAGSYNIRVTDANNLTEVNTTVISGNYLPLSLTTTQQQSSIYVQGINGKAPYKYAISTDFGNSYSTPIDSNHFSCLSPGIYMFRVIDSCGNFYSESVVVNEVIIQADFNCNPNTHSIILNSITGGNGGYIYNAFGVDYNQTNTTGNFQNIYRCNKNISVKITDKCLVENTFLVCPSPDYTFSISCVNFKDKKITIANVANGSGLPYQYIANGVVSNSNTVQNFAITNDTIFAGLIDSCSFKNTIAITKMKSINRTSEDCQNGSVNLLSYYTINNAAVSFPPTVYTSISGPSSFIATDSIGLDSSFVVIRDLETGTYVYKVTNACGDEIIDSFTYVKRCYKEFKKSKIVGCNSVIMNLEKDCKIDTTVNYTLLDMQGNILQQNTTGIFANVDISVCHQIKMYDYVCDTTIIDTLSALKPRFNISYNSCNQASFFVGPRFTTVCASTLNTYFSETYSFILADSLFNVLEINTSGYSNNVPAATKWVIAQSSNCKSDTLQYIPGSGFTDTLHFCITPTVKLVNNHCHMAWNIKVLNNTTNALITLTGNNTNVQGTNNFYSIDTGYYTLKFGCNDQPLFLPNYYDFNTRINNGCPNNASITASYSINNTYINQIKNQYFFTICNAPTIDYNIKEVGTNNPLIFSTSGNYTNLKTGTYYAVFFKGNESCNFHSDTIFTPFYTRPAVTATYGLICNGNNASVKVNVVGGTPPYTYEVLNSSISPITTSTNFLLYNNLPLGTADFRVSDACGVSANYATEVLSVNFEPTIKRRCDGQVQLIAPDIFNTTYVWTNSNNDTIGTTPSIYITPNGDDSFHVQINHLNCTLNKSLFVNDFSSSIVIANAGSDQLVDTSIATLHGNIPPPNAIGFWKQIDPSSGNTVFTNINDPNTDITVDVFPGQYTYVWTITDTVIGCVDEDTVIISFLRCPNIQPIAYTKTIKNAICTNNGEINITITQASTPVHFLWSNGDTTATINNLSKGNYSVLIYDETTCTPDILDSIYIAGTQPTNFYLIDTICSNDTLIVNNKQYYSSGIFYDTTINSVGCDSLIEIQLTVLPTSQLFDTLHFCGNENYTLPNGQIINQTGNYNYVLKNSLGCDSIIYYNITFLPTHNINIDTFICNGANYVLPSGETVQQKGIYIDSFKNIFGCDSIIQTTLTVRDSLPKVFIGNDTIICIDDLLTIQLNYPNYAQFIWQDSTTTNIYSIKDEGIYWVKISDGCSIVSDTILITTQDCSCNFYIPTAFSPNNDGVNDEFQIFKHCDFFKDYKFEIYNRWGELIFISTNFQQGWNGLYNGQPQPLDNYIWQLFYYDIRQNKEIHKKGTLILLK